MSLVLDTFLIVLLLSFLSSPVQIELKESPFGYEEGKDPDKTGHSGAGGEENGNYEDEGKDVAAGAVEEVEEIEEIHCCRNVRHCGMRR